MHGLGKKVGGGPPPQNIASLLLRMLKFFSVRNLYCCFCLLSYCNYMFGFKLAKFILGCEAVSHKCFFIFYCVYNKISENSLIKIHINIGNVAVLAVVHLKADAYYLKYQKDVVVSLAILCF